jgi:Flp pilus assembly protein TadG
MRTTRAERGQILPIVAVALVALLGIAAFSIDVGYAYFAKRQLQSAVDAAALAGAQDLPSPTLSVSTAADYGSANNPTNLPAFVFSYSLQCTATAIVATGCKPLVNPNELVVTGTTSTSTWFAGIFGIKHFDMTAHANACSPCSSTPVDIVIALDRTGSMCDTLDSGSFCRDLDNAKDGIQTMLKILNPPYAQVGMVVFPPVEKTTTGMCSAPYNTLSNGGWDGYDAPGRGYLTDTLASDYKLNGSLNPASGLVIHTTDGKANACVQAGGSTSYSEALRQSESELIAHGRPKVPNYIVFLTDGEANLGSVYGVNSTAYPPGNADDQQPCNTAINLATAYKNAGTTIYSIGYALGNKNCTAGKWPYIKGATVNNKFIPAHYCDPATENNCEHTQGTVSEVANDGTTTITSNATLALIASPGDFKNQPTPGDLNSIFAAIATDIGQGSSRLVDDGF